MQTWNAEQYVKFEKERTQPAADLLQRVLGSPKQILDIGCGPGNSTQQLFMRFPTADILGMDQSQEMLERAKAQYTALRFKQGCVPDALEDMGEFDLIFSNACLHWIPQHQRLLPKLMAHLSAGGVLAVQMPMVQEALFYKVLYDMLATHTEWKKLQAIQNFHNLSSYETYDILAKVSSRVEMWETTYYHVVNSHCAVLDWYKGSGLRPYLAALSETEQTAFLHMLLQEIQKNYSQRADGKIILEMPRLFFTAERI